MTELSQEVSPNSLPRKERYFEPVNINDVSQTMLDEIRKSVRIHNLEFAPDRSALLVLDMQKYFLEEHSHAFVPSAQAIIPHIVNLMTMFTKINRPVIATRHINTAENSGMMSAWWRDTIRQDDPVSELIEAVGQVLLEPDASLVTPQVGMTYLRLPIVKSQYDAFHGTDLEELLRDSSADQVVITGVMTHLCCETTARSAFMKGFGVFIPVDCTATYNIDFHRAAMLNLSHGFAVPTLVREIEKRIKQATHERI